MFFALRQRISTQYSRASPCGQPLRLPSGQASTAVPTYVKIKVTIQRVVIVNKQERLCGRKGREVIWPSN